MNFSEIISSDAYQNKAQGYSSTCIGLAFVTGIIMFAINGFDFSWMLIPFFIVWCTFGVSIFVALPITTANVWIAVLRSKHTNPLGQSTSSAGQILMYMTGLVWFTGAGLSIASTAIVYGWLV